MCLFDTYKPPIWTSLVSYRHYTGTCCSNLYMQYIQLRGWSGGRWLAGVYLPAAVHLHAQLRLADPDLPFLFG